MERQTVHATSEVVHEKLIFGGAWGGVRWWKHTTQLHTIFLGTVTVLCLVSLIVSLLRFSGTNRVFPILFLK